MSDTPLFALGSATRLSAVLSVLSETVDRKAQSDPSTSYTAKLYADGPVACAKKIAEEGAELALAIAAEGEVETASEAADVIYHMLVGLKVKGVRLDDVAAALEVRQGISGLDEKASRG